MRIFHQACAAVGLVKAFPFTTPALIGVLVPWVPLKFARSFK